MSGGSRSSRPSENWQPGPDYWIYLPTNLSDFLPPRRTPSQRGRTRDPRWFLEERSIRGPNNGLVSYPSTVNRRPSVRLLLIDDYDTYLGTQTPVPETPPAFQEPRYTQEEESMLTPQQQKQAINKLRKQLYSPHMSNIIRRLSIKSSGSNVESFQQDDDGKRCAVCLEDFETRQFVTLTPCNHMFHEDCIVPWVKRQGKCPICRFVIAE
ncbi:uncharacterized protein LOC105176825 [Sesamum indicum]|uniref:Uncharacterized protein LOC105176825 n=1 Tax=Sesamum indicum TaxID=4182 RepID=A0A6I9UDP1_SESIN|nr:uncharacterized protein LOC105176825 [Sesamum indicum]